jgi:aerotaxis receptor
LVRGGRFAFSVAAAAPRNEEMTSVPPSTRESPFAADELFFSTTDPKGIIRASNEVFIRVSRHPREALDGHAHNRVRHPDMPRAIFQHFWDVLRAGRPIAAYVKNLAADGSHYWVMASVVPIEGGYLSVRLKPSTEHFAVAQQLYARLLEAEAAVEGGDVRRRKASIAAGMDLLSSLLTEAGFDSYEAFMNVALPAEVSGREVLLGTTARQRLGRPPVDADPELVALLDRCAATHDFLDYLVANLEQFAALNRTLEDKSRFVSDLADSIRLFSLNALLASTRLGTDGAALGAVAGLMRVRSDSAGPIISALSHEITGAVDLLNDMGFRIAATKLQTEMLMSFTHELMGGAVDSRVAAELGPLAAAMADGTEGLLASLAALNGHLSAVMRHVSALTGDLDQLRALEVNGRIEAAKAGESGNVKSLFQTIGEQVGAARVEMTGFDGVAKVVRRRDAGAQALVLEHVGAVRERVAALAALAA